MIRAAWLLVVVCVVGSCGERDPVVGVMLPLTSDDLAEWGSEAYDGFVLARDEFDLAQPPLVQDTGGTVRGTIDAFEALVREGATVVIGPLGTDAAKAVGVVARRHRVPFVTPSATGPGVVADNPFAFRFCYDDVDAATALATFARDTLGLRRMAVVVDLGTSYSVDLATAFQKQFVRRRGEIVAEIGYWGDEPAGTAALDRVAGLDVEGALVAGYGADVARMVRASTDPRLADLVVLGGDGWDHGGLRAVLPGAVDQAFHTSHFHVDDPRAAVVGPFVERFTAAYQVAPSDFAALTYDTTRAVLSVFDPALDGPAMANRLQSLRGFDGVTGVVTMDPDGNPTGKGIVLEELVPSGASLYVERTSR